MAGRQQTQDILMLKQLLAIKERRRDKARHRLAEARDHCRQYQAEHDRQQGELAAMRQRHAARLARLRDALNSQAVTGSSHVALQSQEVLFRKLEGEQEEAVDRAASELAVAEQAVAAANMAFLDEVKAVEKVTELHQLVASRKAG